MERRLDTSKWWQGAVFYQIYPRSFYDSNGDGIGDLQGICAKLDYLQSLNVDALWVSPFFKSPMKDFGYDVSDYRDIDPIFGNLQDCQDLIDGAHARGLKVVFDLVLSHTSDQHPWFAQSRESRNNDKADWYVWADPRPDGSPPNNWQAFFGGPSWSFDVRRGQYYMHNFLPSQPDLNLHNPAVQEAALDIFKFWLERGVDGFRLDVANCYMHDPALRDNPASDDPAPQFFNVDFPTPFTMQDHIYDFTRPENIAFIQRIRALLDQYDERMTVAEIAFNRDCTGVAYEYTKGTQRFHTAYNFTLISGDKASAKFIRYALNDFNSRGDESWPSWALSNHDTVRAVSRWGGKPYEDDPRFAKVLLAMLCSLRGTAFIYQGEELGLPEADIAFEDIQDPWGKFLYPHWQGRDGCRTPIPWDAEKPQAGFTAEAARPWLPVAQAHYERSVSRQEGDHASVLAFTRFFLNWRATQDLLRTGAISFYDAVDDDVLIFTRTAGEDMMLCAFNFSSCAKNMSLPAGLAGDLLPVAMDGAPAQYGALEGGVLSLPAFGMFYASGAAGSE